MEKKVHTIDASRKKLGRLSSEIAILLRGKNKASFQPHLDEGNEVRVINIDKMEFSGKKLDQKMYYRHSGYLGGLKTESLRKLLARKPEDILRQAVSGMLPKNKLRPKMLKKLIIR
ncbi:MAG: 50S ribosomal protein L13 [Parcubacteria group bacterium]|nr:50S ribosomal protein L13 [Parcubacteria group bacterium]